jgi:hypothetical protein
VASPRSPDASPESLINQKPSDDLGGFCLLRSGDRFWRLGSDLPTYLLLISAFNRRIIASRLSEGSAPVITSMRSPRCMAIVRSV